MRGFKAIMLLLAASVGITTGNVVNMHQHQHDGSRALAAANDLHDIDMFYRRLDPVGGTTGGPLGPICCGTCTQVTFFDVIIFLLVEIGSSNAGQLNPAVLGYDATVTIIVRITLVYTELNDNGDAASGELTIIFEATVEPEDWTTTPCSYIQDDCIVFQNDKLILFAPDAPGLPGVLSIEAFDNFTADSNVDVISDSCDVRCDADSDCTGFEIPGTIDLDSEGPGTSFGSIVQSTFNNGFCDPGIFDEPDYSYSYSYFYF